MFSGVPVYRSRPSTALFLLMFLAGIVALVAAAAGLRTVSQNPTPAPATSAATRSAASAAPTTLTVAMTGDILSHSWVTAASREADGKYHLEKLLAEVKPYLERADLALCHQEIPYGKPGQDPHGYPVFNAPMDWANGLVRVGYDGCSTASNHSWDQETEGITHTLEVLQNAGLGTAGTRANAEQTPWQMYEIRKGGRTVHVAHLSFTYGLNFESVPEVDRHPYLVEINDVEQIIDYARQARQAGADIVIVSPHGGSEYVYEPQPQQRQWAQALAQSGVVDAYVGHHAHVPQPITLTPGGVNGAGMWTYFGTGNLLTSQNPEMGIGTQIESIAWLSFDISGPAKHPRVTLSNAAWVPVVLDRSRLHAVPVHDFDDGTIPPGSRLDAATVQRYHEELVKVMGTEATELQSPPPAPAEPAVVTVLPR